MHISNALGHAPKGEGILERSKQAAVVGALITLVSLALVTSSVEAAEESTSSIEREALCPMELEPANEHHFECGWLTVPEQADADDSPQLRLAYAVARASTATSRADPILVIFGGPGTGPIKRIQRLLTIEPYRTARQQRDLIFLDVRGTGFSEPKVCTGIDEILKQTDILVDGSDVVNERLIAEAKACAKYSRVGGPDPGAYNSPAVARDFEALRQALGVERWNIWAFSYGGRYAQTLMREYPHTIRSVVLDTPVTLDRPWSRVLALREALDAVFAQCAEDPSCAVATPDPQGDLTRLLSQVETTPITIEVDPQVPLPEPRLILSRETLVRYIQRGLIEGNLGPALPRLLQEATQGEYEALLMFLPYAVEGQRVSRHAEGLALATLCYDDAMVTPEFLSSVRELNPLISIGGWYDARLDILCPHLHAARASERERTVADTGIPTLVLAGSHDATVPPSMPRHAASVESGAILVDLPYAGHGLVGRHLYGCGFLLDFVDDPSSVDVTECPAVTRATPFFSDIHPVIGMSRFAGAVLLSYPGKQRGPGIDLLTAWPMVSLLFLLLAPPIWGVRYAWQRIRCHSGNTETTAPIALWLGVVTSVTAVTFFVGLNMAVSSAQDVSFRMLAFGVPAGFGWIFALPWLLIVLSVAVVVASVMAWKRNWWSGWLRFHYTLVALATLGFTAFLWYWPLV